MSISKTRTRASFSDVWHDMDEVKKVINGKEVRRGAIRKYYKSHLCASSSNGGTGQLRSHIRSCERKALAASSSSQSGLHFTSNCNVQHFQYNSNVSRSEFYRLIARLVWF
jgi:hypothetical protein